SRAAQQRRGTRDRVSQGDPGGALFHARALQHEAHAARPDRVRFLACDPHRPEPERLPDARVAGGPRQVAAAARGPPPGAGARPPGAGELPPAAGPFDQSPGRFMTPRATMPSFNEECFMSQTARVLVVVLLAILVGAAVPALIELRRTLKQAREQLESTG